WITEIGPRDCPRFCLRKILTGSPFGKFMAHAERFALTVDIDLILFRPFGHVSFEPCETNEPGGRSDVYTKQFHVALASRFLPYKSIHLSGLSLDPAQDGPGGIELSMPFSKGLACAVFRFCAANADWRRIGVEGRREYPCG